MPLFEALVWFSKALCFGGLTLGQTRLISVSAEVDCTAAADSNQSHDVSYDNVA
jgi:hypothetical protein